jgi:hypothetical protein
MNYIKIDRFKATQFKAEDNVTQPKERSRNEYNE